MKETSLSCLADSNPIVMLTQGQLRELIKQEIHSAINPNGGFSIRKSDVTAENWLTHKPYLSVAEAAKLTGLGTSTIRLCIRKGELRCQRPHRRIIIHRAELEKFLGAAPA